MKCELAEYEGCFAFDMQAESVADAAILARLKMNGKKEVRSINASAHRNGAFLGCVVIGKTRQPKEYFK